MVHRDDASCLFRRVLLVCRGAQHGVGQKKQDYYTDFRIRANSYLDRRVTAPLVLSGSAQLSYATALLGDDAGRREHAPKHLLWRTRFLPLARMLVTSRTS